MKLIFAALAAALSFVTGGSQREQALTKTVSDLQTQNKDLSDNLSAVHGAFDALKTDDDATKEALQKSKDDLKATQDAGAQTATDYAALKADVDAAAVQSGDLLAKINGSTAIPVTVTDDGVNHDTAHPSNDTRAPSGGIPTDLPTDPTVEITNDPTPVAAAGSGSPQ